MHFVNRPEKRNSPWILHFRRGEAREAGGADSPPLGASVSPQEATGGPGNGTAGRTGSF